MLEIDHGPGNISAAFSAREAAPSIHQPPHFPLDKIERAAYRVWQMSKEPQGEVAEKMCFAGGLRALTMGEFPDILED